MPPCQKCQPSTLKPMERAVPSIMRMAASTPEALRSFILSVAISFTWSFVTVPTTSLEGVLEALAPWAVGLFEIKEHLGSVALAMLPWLVVSAHRYGRLSRLERIGYVAGTCVFTVFVYYVFVAGALVATIKSF